MHTEQLIDALKRVLKSRQMTYAQLARAIDLSEASVKRLFSQRTFTLQRLQQVLRVLELDFFELAKLARGAADTAEQLSPSQEQALAADRKLLGVFYLLFNDWQPAEIIARYELTQAECIRLLARLDRLGLIELLPNDRVRLRVARNLRLSPNGPVRRAVGDEAMQEFLSVRFDEHGGHFRFEYRELSKASYEVLARRLDRLAAEFNELAELDSTLPAAQRSSIGLAAGIRPWRIGLVTGLKERGAAGARKK
jgi:transcriptional regulator with XRE-family HTH domain